MRSSSLQLPISLKASSLPRGVPKVSSLRLGASSDRHRRQSRRLVRPRTSHLRVFLRSTSLSKTSDARAHSAVQIATIASSISPAGPFSSPSAASQSTATDQPQSSSRPGSRRSDFNRQIYQFALGYPQTPPDTSPEVDPIGPLLNGGNSPTHPNMGTFLFKW